MDIITSAIEKKYHIHKTKLQNEQTWENYKKMCEHRKVFLFGTGSGAMYCFDHFPDGLGLDGAIDNDEKKQGYVFSDCYMETVATPYHDIKIYALDYLKQFKPQDVVVLITSTKYYQTMIEQIEELGIKNIFVLLLLEVNNPERKEIVRKEIEFLVEREQLIDKCSKLGINKKRIVFSYGAYGGHCKYITYQLLKIRNDLDIVWLVEDIEKSHPAGVRLVPLTNWKKYIYEMETAGVWIYDIMVPDYIIKRTEQNYIQVKHWSSITLKKFYLEDASTCGNSIVVDEINYNAEMMNYVFTGSKFDEDSCKKGFGVNDIFVRVGSPRSDVLFTENVKERVFNKYELHKDIKCVMYAPTFREKERSGQENFHLQLDCAMLKSTLKKKFGGEWVVFLRLHPLIAKQIDNISFDKYIINVSEYEDSQELVASADILITDYSSLMFEPAFVKRPVFLFATDRSSYIDNERQLLLDYNSLPFTISESNDELISHILNFDYNSYLEKLNDFMEKYEISEDGQASKRAADFIINIIDS